ncbi:MAG: HD domain-containing protein [Treponema sp.]|nr:HD domain-containing protein [Treponema sp.]
MEFLRLHQQNIMLFLSGICFVLAILSFFTKSLPKQRRRSLILIEIVGAMLLLMDRFAYIFRGDTSTLGWWMVRISNFCVFLFSLCIIHSFNLYLVDLYKNECGLKEAPTRLRIVEVLFTVGVIMLIISQFTGWYYTFDKYNRYQRGSGLIVCYIFPFISMVLQLSVIIQYYRQIKRTIRIPILLFDILPIAATILQLFSYGVSLQNITMVGEAIVLYIFVIVDMNESVERANKMEIDFLRDEQKTMRVMFEQTAEALASAIDAKDSYTHGHSTRVADYSKQIAIHAGKSDKECAEVYYAGLLHDVGKIGIPSNIINKNGKLTDEEYAQIKAHPVIGNQILSRISKSPYLSIGAHYHHERYDGRGYPEGLKGDDIPDIARIIAVADAYDAMTSKRSYRDPIPQQKVREEIVKGSGTQFDPQYAKIMLHLIDLDTEYEMKEREEVKELAGKNYLSCDEYGTSYSEGILINREITKITLTCRAASATDEKVWIPSFIVFDSLDARIHRTEEKQRDMLYFEYARIRFDGKTECLGARKVQTDTIPVSDSVTEFRSASNIDYDVEAIRIKDHALIRITNAFQTVQIILALPDSTRYLYLGLTGEHCEITDIGIKKTGIEENDDAIPRIAEEISYIQGPEGDVPNIQIDNYRLVHTNGIPVKDGMKITFHTMSLPTARLIWHCPFIDLYYSPDQKVNMNSPDYLELALIRLDGENWEQELSASETKIIVNKNEKFEGWEAWKNLNKQGMDCEVSFSVKGKQIIVVTENAGISIKCIVTVKADIPQVYAALTGDQCAITNIRIKD